MSSLRLHSSSPDKLESCQLSDSMPSQKATSANSHSVRQFAGISSNSFTVTSRAVAVTCAVDGSKAIQQASTVRLKTDPLSSSAWSDLQSSSGASHLSDPSSTGHCTPTAAITLKAAKHDALIDESLLAASADIQPAADIKSAVQSHTHSPQLQQEVKRRDFSWKIKNYLVIPICLPAIVCYWLACLLVAAAVTFTVLPSLYLAKQLYWACPFIPYIWGSNSVRGKYGVVGSWLMRLSFEGAHCMTVLGRLLTLPIRPALPEFYVLGFPVRLAAAAWHVHCEDLHPPRSVSDILDTQCDTAWTVADD